MGILIRCWYVLEKTKKETKNELDYTGQVNWYCCSGGIIPLSTQFIPNIDTRVCFSNNDILVLYCARGTKLIDIILSDCLDIMKDMSDDSVLDSSAHRPCL